MIIDKRDDDLVSFCKQDWLFYDVSHYLKKIQQHNVWFWHSCNRLDYITIKKRRISWVSEWAFSKCYGKAHSCPNQLWAIFRYQLRRNISFFLKCILRPLLIIKCLKCNFLISFKSYYALIKRFVSIYIVKTIRDCKLNTLSSTFSCEYNVEYASQVDILL